MSRYTTHGRRWTQQRELAREMRHAPTAAEELLWERLRGKRLGGVKFRRQHAIGRFIVDFYCVERGIAIEVDGGIHDSQRAEDGARQEYLEERGVRFLRFTNDAILQDIETVVNHILGALAAPNPPLHDVERGWPISSRRRRQAGGEVRAPAPDPQIGVAR